MAVRTDLTVNWWESPRIITIDAPSTEMTVQDLVDSLRHLEAILDTVDNDHLIDAAGKEDLGGGVTVGITATLNNAKVRFESRTTPLSGPDSITTADTDGKRAYASGATWVADGIYQGCTIYNSTTGSMETVIEVVSETEIKSFQISGGSRNDWQVGDSVYVYPNVQCSLSGGNIVAIDSNGNSMEAVLQSSNVQVVRTSSSSATLQELSAIQHSSFNNGVTIDVVNGTSGTSFPKGTSEEPVNNLADAVTIAAERGFSNLYIKGSFTVGSGDDMSDYLVSGEYHDRTTITIQTGATVTDTQFNNIAIASGSNMDSNFCVVQDGALRSCSNFNGNVYFSEISGTIVLNLGSYRHWIRCTSNQHTTPPTLDFNSVDQDLIITGYTGDFKVANMTAGRLVVYLDSGAVELLSSCTGGTVIINGIGDLTDNSNGTSVTSTGLTNQDTIAEAVWHEPFDTYTTDAHATCMGAALTRTLGLLQENHYLDNTTYDTYSGQKLLTGGRIRIYSNAASVGTSDGVMASYTVTASWTNDEMQAYKVVKN